MQRCILEVASSVRIYGIGIDAPKVFSISCGDKIDKM